MKSTKTVLVVAIVIAGFAGTTFSQHTGKETICGITESGSFQGKPKVYVLIEELDEELKRTGISRQQLTTEVELLLRKFDVPVVKSEAAEIVLYIWVMGNELVRATSEEGIGWFYYAVKCEVSQPIRLIRNPSIICVNATTWHTRGHLELASNKSMPTAKIRITNIIKDQTKQFINAYLEANPK